MKNRAIEMEDDGAVTSETHTDRIRSLNRERATTFRRLYPDFMKWLEELSRFGGNLVDAMVLSESSDPIAKAEFYTEKYRYVITARPDAKTENAEEYDSGYLGAIASKRQPWAGEDWTRLGSDLFDGPYCEKTWHCIMADIISYEMVRLGK